VLNSHGARVTENIVFDASHALKLDVYQPANAQKAPVVVFLYGGAWQSGAREWYRYVGQSLSKRGVVVVIPDYRKYPQVKFPDFVDDAAKAVSWARANAQSIHGDPTRLFIVGHSAGAHIGALLATDAKFLAKVDMKPRDLAGFVGLAGPYDFAPFRDKKLVAIFGEDATAQSAAMPAEYVDGDEPPMLLLQGLSDGEVDPKNSTRFAAKLNAVGDRVATKFYPNVGHIGLVLSLAPAFARSSTALDDTIQFIAP
jgi:acetyl esterase/lipase